MTQENAPQNPSASAPSSDANSGGIDKAMTFEAALEKLQQTVKRLESGELSLDQALKNFEEGVRLTRFCQQHLSSAEQKVELLMQASADGRIETQPFGATGQRG